MPTGTPTFLTRFGSTGLRLLANAGLDGEAFARALRVPAPLPDRLPSRTLDQAIELALNWTQDPHFGLLAGAHWHPSDLGALGFAWLSSDSLGAGLQRMARYQQVLGQRMAASCQSEPEGMVFVYSHGRGLGPVGEAMARFELSVLCAMVKANLGPDTHPVEVRLRQAAPADPMPYEAVFHAPVRFGAAHDALVFRWDDVQRPLATSHQALASVFDEHLARELAALSPDDWAARCKNWLLERLTSGEPTEADLAQALAVSPRTLHRRLRLQGTSYRQVLAQTRMALAERYLMDSRRSVTEITFLLGFSEQSAFSRAFTRWRGVSPSAFRQHSLRVASGHPEKSMSN